MDLLKPRTGVSFARRMRWALPVVLLTVGVATVALAEATTQPAQTTTAPAASSPAEFYGLWVLAPPLVAIGLAILTRQVIASLFLGTLVAAYMLAACPGGSLPFADSHTMVRGLRLTMEHYIVGTITKPDKIQIMLFTLTIGGMVGVVGANGGTRAMVDLFSRWARSPRRAQIVGWFGGHLIFFDDYANTMILGPTLRPLFDRLRISRAKLAYIVDSTAAPVASLVPIGTWIGFEIGLIDSGLEAVRQTAEQSRQVVPAFLSNASAYGVFLASIGYRFYAVFALALVLIVALTRRDLGPMKRFERSAEPSPPGSGDGGETRRPGRWWLALWPVVLMVVLTVVILLGSGWQTFPKDRQLGWSTLPILLKEADPYLSILYGAVAGLALAILLSTLTGRQRLREAVDAGIEGMGRMFPAIVILVLAWALSKATESLELGQVTIALLSDRAESLAVYFPLAVFGASCLASFAMGTSWGTLSVLCPLVVQVSAALYADLDPSEALPLFHSSVGAVLAGSIFGDHCSPISDTTVLSSIASSCRLEDHVWTQIPYALIAAVVSVGAGHLLCNVAGQPWYIGLLAGVVLLVLIMLIFGRQVRPPDVEPAPSV